MNNQESTKFKICEQCRSLVEEFNISTNSLQPVSLNRKVGGAKI